MVRLGVVLLGMAACAGVLAATGCSSDESDIDDDPDEDDDSAEDEAEDDGDEAPNDGGALEDAGSDDAATAVTGQSTDGGVNISVPDSGLNGGLNGGLDAGAGPTFRITGELQISDTLFRDSDSKDQGALYIPNDTLDVSDPDADAAQLISSPGSVTGYLGPIVTFDDDDNEVTVRDNVDYYKVTLAEGQTVTLFAAEVAEDAEGNLPIQADLDLFLLDADENDISDGGAWVDDSMGVGDKEQVTAPRTDTYWIAVERYQDPEVPEGDDSQAVYTLAVGIQQPAAIQAAVARQKLSTFFPAVVGEALLVRNYGPPSATNAAAMRYLQPGSNALGMAHVRFEKADTMTALPERTGLRQTIDSIKRLLKSGLEASPNYILQTTSAAPPNDPLFASQWHYEQINLEAAWEQTDQVAGGSRGEGVVVAVLDTGVAMDHPDFFSGGESQLTDDGYDMVSNPNVAADGNGRDDDPNDPGDGRTPGDHSFHGTHCAGTVAAATDNGEGASGIAPNAKVMPVRVLGRGGGSMADIVQGVLYAAGLENDTGELPDQPADVISMSLGGPGFSSQLEAAVAAARAAGSIVVAAAGNDNSLAAIYSPAGTEGVVTVAATDFEKERAPYSNHGAAIDIAAPGGNTSADKNLDGQPDGVISLVNKNNGATKYAAYQGTSMACPHVSGVAALMKSIWADMTPTDFDEAISSGSIVVDNGDPLAFGAGLLNASKAVAYAIEQAGEDVMPQPVLSVSTTVLDFGGDLVSLALAIGDAGDGNLTLGDPDDPLADSVSVDQPWVNIDGVTLGMGSVEVDRDAVELAAGVNTATITIRSNGGSKDVAVRVFVGTQPDGGDIDDVYVMMVDAKTGDAVRQTFAFREAGIELPDGTESLPDYGFEIDNIPAGAYYLVAGTDMADTGFVGNDGDGYGAFPLSQDPRLICRFVEQDEAGCPQLTDEERAALAEEPNIVGAIVPMQILVDLGAQEVDDEAAEDLGAFQAASSATQRPSRVRLLFQAGDIDWGGR